MVLQDFKGCFTEITMFEINALNICFADSAGRAEGIPQQRPAQLQHFILAARERTARKPNGGASDILRVECFQILCQYSDLLQLARRGGNGSAGLSKRMEHRQLLSLITG